MTLFELELPAPYLLAAVAIAFAHASFQLGVSVLTLLSSHVIGSAKSHTALLRLDSGYLLGVIVATFATFLSVSSVVDGLAISNPLNVWLGLACISSAMGLLIVAFYYRRAKGTTLWVPRLFAQYLSTRTKKTKSSIEAFVLGLATVVAELPFTLITFVLAAFLVRQQSDSAQLVAAGLYTLLVCLPLLVVAGLITSGHKISTIQKWREENKTFLQWSSGVTLVLIGVYLVVLHTGSGGLV